MLLWNECAQNEICPEDLSCRPGATKDMTANMGFTLPSLQRDNYIRRQQSQGALHTKVEITFSMQLKGFKLGTWLYLLRCGYLWLAQQWKDTSVCYDHHEKNKSALLPAIMRIFFSFKKLFLITRRNFNAIITHFYTNIFLFLFLKLHWEPLDTIVKFLAYSSISSWFNLNGKKKSNEK